MYNKAINVRQVGVDPHHCLNQNQKLIKIYASIETTLTILNFSLKLAIIFLAPQRTWISPPIVNCSHIMVQNRKSIKLHRSSAKESNPLYQQITCHHTNKTNYTKDTWQRRLRLHCIVAIITTQLW